MSNLVRSKSCSIGYNNNNNNNIKNRTSSTSGIFQSPNNKKLVQNEINITFQKYLANKLSITNKQVILTEFQNLYLTPNEAINILKVLKQLDGEINRNEQIDIDKFINELSPRIKQALNVARAMRKDHRVGFFGVTASYILLKKFFIQISEKKFIGQQTEILKEKSHYVDSKYSTLGKNYSIILPSFDNIKESINNTNNLNQLFKIDQAVKECDVEEVNKNICNKIVETLPLNIVNLNEFFTYIKEVKDIGRINIISKITKVNLESKRLIKNIIRDNINNILANVINVDNININDLCSFIKDLEVKNEQDRELIFDIFKNLQNIDNTKITSEINNKIWVALGWSCANNKINDNIENNLLNVIKSTTDDTLLANINFYFHNEDNKNKIKCAISNRMCQLFKSYIMIDNEINKQESLDDIIVNYSNKIYDITHEEIKSILLTKLIDILSKNFKNFKNHVKNITNIKDLTIFGTIAFEHNNEDMKNIVRIQLNNIQNSNKVEELHNIEKQSFGNFFEKIDNFKDLYDISLITTTMRDTESNEILFPKLTKLLIDEFHNQKLEKSAIKFNDDFKTKGCFSFRDKNNNPLGAESGTGYQQSLYLSEKNMKEGEEGLSYSLDERCLQNFNNKNLKIDFINDRLRKNLFTIEQKQLFHVAHSNLWFFINNIITLGAHFYGLIQKLSLDENPNEIKIVQIRKLSAELGLFLRKTSKESRKYCLNIAIEEMKKQYNVFISENDIKNVEGLFLNYDYIF